MDRRSLLASGAALFGSTALGQAPDREAKLAESVQKIMELVKTIQVGSRRKSLEADWRADGGIQFRWTTRYNLRICAGVKINVDFENHGDEWNFGSPEDVIEKVSRAYIESPYYD